MELQDLLRSSGIYSADELTRMIGGAPAKRASPTHTAPPAKRAAAAPKPIARVRAAAPPSAVPSSKYATEVRHAVGLTTTETMGCDVNCQRCSIQVSEMVCSLCDVRLCSFCDGALHPSDMHRETRELLPTLDANSVLPTLDDFRRPTIDALMQPAPRSVKADKRHGQIFSDADFDDALEDAVRAQKSLLAAPSEHLGGKQEVAAQRQAEWLADVDHAHVVMAQLPQDGIVTAADYYERLCEQYAENEVLVSVHTKERYTYAQLDSYANRVAQWALAQDVQPGETVALMMENCPMFIATWLGLSKIAAKIACINTNLSGANLTHALTVASCDRAIVSTAYKARIQADADASTVSLRSLWWAAGSGLRDDDLAISCDSCIDLAIAVSSSARPDRSIRASVLSTDALFYMYTSGTTGRSKAAVFSHYRFIGAGVTWAQKMQLSSADNYYCALPLYHGNGGVVAVSAAMRAGATLVLREKFSVRGFLPDIRKHGCTATIYIGELWRYLHNSPRKPDDAQNCLRVAAGNGLRGDIWEAVVERFGVERIVEHYGQTEMPSAHPMINTHGVAGSCGFIPPVVRGECGTEKLIRWDVEAECVIRNGSGFAVECAEDEMGEAVVQLDTETYSGYSSKESTDKVVYRDLFEKGDCWYHSGDLLKVNSEGYFFFVDRIGDTFRWKGENVATTEVAEALCEVPAVLEANVYGVQMASTEGKAGMGAILLSDGQQFEAAAVYRQCASLPAYARPVFLRLRDGESLKTSTFKFVKHAYQKQGFDPRTVGGDKLLWRCDRSKTFLPLDNAAYAAIQRGEVRF